MVSFFSAIYHGGILYLQSEPPTSFQWHGEERHNGVCNCQMKHQEVNIGSAPAFVLVCKLVIWQHSHLMAGMADFL